VCCCKSSGSTGSGSGSGVASPGTAQTGGNGGSSDNTGGNTDTGGNSILLECGTPGYICCDAGTPTDKSDDTCKVGICPTTLSPINAIGKLCPEIN